MLYHYNGETFKLESRNKVKLYHKAVNKWSTGWTFIGEFKSSDKAKLAAKQYAS